MGAGNPSFAVPTEGTDAPGWHDSPVTAYAPRLDDVPGGTPDPMRELVFPTRDYRPDPHQAPEAFWVGMQGPGRDYMARHQVEFLDADGIETTVGSRPQAPRPPQPPEPRWTQRLSPHTFLFTRPFAQDTARYFSGDHFSMADHRRTYAILGMAPSPYKRNTFRADPPPWDDSRIDMPQQAPPSAPGHLIAYELPPPSGGAWRLG